MVICEIIHKLDFINQIHVYGIYDANVQECFFLRFADTINGVLSNDDQRRNDDQDNNNVVRNPPSSQFGQWISLYICCGGIQWNELNNIVYLRIVVVLCCAKCTRERGAQNKWIRRNLCGLWFRFVGFALCYGCDWMNQCALSGLRMMEFSSKLLSMG